jgi:hypothetical protein
VVYELTVEQKSRDTDLSKFPKRNGGGKMKSVILSFVSYLLSVILASVYMLDSQKCWAVGGISNSKVVVPSTESVEKGRFEIEPFFGLAVLDDEVENSNLVKNELSLIEDDEEWLPDRPDVAESAFVVPPGRFQVETGITVGEARGEEEVSVITPFLFRYGFYEDFELRVGGPGLIREEGGANFGDLDLGIKYHLLDEDVWSPAIGLIPQVTLPTASRDAGSDSVDPRLFLTFDKDLPVEFTIEWNLGAGYIDKPEDSGRFFQVLYAASLSRPLVRPLIVFAEVYGVSKVEPGEGGSINTDFGVIFRLSKNIVLDLGGDFGITNANQQNVFIGLSFRL